MRRLPQALRALIVTVVIGGVAVGACLAALLVPAGTIANASYYESTKLGELSQLYQRSTVYDAAGNVLAVLGLENREPIENLDEVPPILQQAVIAVEDKTFWDNNGVDLHGTVRALIKNFTEGGVVQGGSTISQQLIKNRILSNKRSVNRKIREIILAIQLNKKFSKKEILEQYLNTVYFGQGSYGVKSAVERMFQTETPFGPVPSTTLANVTVGQAALLAGLISNPEGNNPFVYPDRAARRRSLALENMVEEGYITQEQADAAEQEPIPTVLPVAELRPTTAWAEEVQDRLFNDPMFTVLGETPEEREQTVLTGGLEIHATLDPKIQTDANNAVRAILPSGKAGFTASLVSIDPQNGFVKAMVEGAGWTQERQYNIATSYPGRQSGSTWKVITLAAALESGVSPADFVDGSSPCEFKQYGRTVNAGEGSSGMQTVRAATANSTNCAFARMELGVGFQRVMDTAQKMGITQNTLKPILTLTLGTIETTPLEMASVSATIAGGGMYHQPTFVSKIVAPDGEIVFDATDLVPKRAISKEAADCTTDLMRGVVNGGTGGAARLNDRPVAGKTGTTDNQADANFIGFTPQLATFVWHGDPLLRTPGAGFGGGIPARIFKRFMDAAHAGLPVEQLPAPGPFCARSAAFITENGRVATFNGLLPGQSTVPTQAPPTVIINPPTILPSSTTSTTLPPCNPNPALPPQPPNCQ